VCYRPGMSPCRWIGLALALCLAACSPTSRTSPTSTAKAPRETVHDLVALFPVAEVRREVGGIDFGDFAARAHLVSGWSRNEHGAEGTSFVWSQGEVSTLEFFLAAPRDLQTAIRCAPFSGGGPAPQSMRVEVNGHRLGEVVMSPGMRVYVIALPRAALRPGMNRLAFRYRNVAAMEGHRRAAVQWDELRFRPARLSGAEPPRRGKGGLYLPFGSGLVYYLDVPGAGELALPAVRGAAGGRLVVTAEEEGGEPASHELEPGSNARTVELPGRGRHDSRLVRLALRSVAPAPGAPNIDGGLWLAAPVVRAAHLGREKAPSAGRPRRGPPRPNVIIYLVDTLRADRLGCYGGARPISPAVDAFAAGATLFEQAVAQSTWTRPSVTSVLTGLGPLAHGVRTQEDRLAAAAVTLPEMLRAAGYRTAAFSTNLHVTAATGLAQGFDHFELLPGAPRSDAVNRRVLQWLEEDRGASPFFLYIHTLDPHAPYEPPFDLLQRFAPGVAPLAGTLEEVKRVYAARGDERARAVARLSALYDAEIAGNDRSFGELLAALRRRGLYDPALVVFVADHGEEFDEHGSLGHGNDLYAETLDVPLIVKWPRQARGERVRNLAQHVDLLPTILRACGLRPPAGLPGEDLYAPAAGRRVFSHLSYEGREGMSVVAGNWKLILPLSKSLGPGAELYRRDTDPADQTDVSEENEVRAGWLRAQIRLEMQHTRGLEAERVPVDEETRKALNALGYQ
jgi:choline-sulfatase